MVYMYLHLVASMVNVGEYTQHMEITSNYNFQTRIHVLLFVHSLN